MKISSVRFVKSATQQGDFPRDERPEVAFCGRSNIGKSSLLNTLAHSRGLARTSSSPGRTKTINFFLINESFYFVDLPGYGYAKVAKTLREEWGPMIEGFLKNRPQLKLAVMLVDSRMPPAESDIAMKRWLEHCQVPHAVVFTKTDKISRNQLTAALRKGAETLKTKEIIPFSAVTALGRDVLWSRIAAAVQ